MKGSVWQWAGKRVFPSPGGKRRFGTGIFTGSGPIFAALQPPVVGSNLGFYRILPRVTASYRIKFFSRQAERGTRMGTGALRRYKGTEARGQAELGSNMGKSIPKWWKSVRFFALFHGFSRFITEIRPVIPRFSRFLG
jgi:hypothetical protein